MEQFNGRRLHLIKEALAIAALAIERQDDDRYCPHSDMLDMQELLEYLIDSETELAMYQRSARNVFKGKP